MTQATAVLDEPATHEQAEAEEADLLAGFAQGDSDAPSTTSLTETPDEPAKPDTTEPPASDPTPSATQEAPVVDFASALKRIEELESKHKKYSDDVQGRMGLVEQVLKAQARTPAGQKVRVKREDFGEFGTDYPEFADAQLKVINKVLDELELAGLSHEFTSNLLKDAGTTAETAAEKKFVRQRSLACREDLDETHPGWRETIGLPDKDVADGGTAPDTDYRRWLATQPNGYGEKVLNSYSSVVIGRSIDKFNDWKKAQTPKPNSTATPSTRQQKLTSAVTVKPSASVPKGSKEPTEEDDMMDAFNGKK